MNFTRLPQPLSYPFSVFSLSFLCLFSTFSPPFLYYFYTFSPLYIPLFKALPRIYLLFISYLNSRYIQDIYEIYRGYIGDVRDKKIRFPYEKVEKTYRKGERTVRLFRKILRLSHTAKSFWSHLKVGSDVQHGSTKHDFRLFMQETIVAFRRCLEALTISMLLSTYGHMFKKTMIETIHLLILCYVHMPNTIP